MYADQIVSDNFDDGNPPRSSAGRRLKVKRLSPPRPMVELNRIIHARIEAQRQRADDCEQASPQSPRDRNKPQP